MTSNANAATGSLAAEKPQDPRAGLPLWTAASAAEATGGKLRGEWSVTGVSIDTRTLKPGDLFIAIRGENFDGHGFVKQALEKGAGAVMVAVEPAGLPDDAPLLIVNDTMRGLYNLAAAARRRMAGKVIGVTGSVGKTGTKEMLRQVLSAQGATHATEGNLNNHIGLPLTLARMPGGTRFAVLEMGMSHAGEIEPLSRLARPDVAIITAVEAVHSEFFDGINGIADAKAEIFAGLNRAGTAVLNADSRLFEHLVMRAKERGIDNIVGFGEHDRSRATLWSCDLQSDHSQVDATVLSNRVRYRLNMPGRHLVMNSLAVLSAVSLVGGDVQKASVSLADMHPLKGRGEVSQITLAEGGTCSLVDESYNASPAAMRAAFEQMGRVTPTGKGRRIAILGDMLELGRVADAMHADLAPGLEENGISLLYAVGHHMKALYDAMPPAMRGGYTTKAEEMIPILEETLRAGDVLLVKGSFGMRMGRIVQTLQEGPGQETS